MMRAMVVAGLMCVAGAAGADERGFSGTDLLKVCDGSLGDWGDGACLFYISGFNEGVNFGGMITLMQTEGYNDFSTTYQRHQSLIKSCRPESVTNEQVRLVVTKYLSDHPERLHEAAKFLIPDAMKAAFPCD